MSFLAALVSSGGLLFLPMMAQNTLSVLGAGSTRLEIEYEAVTPVPWLGRQKTGSLSFLAEFAPNRYRVTVSTQVEGIVDWFVDSSTMMATSGHIRAWGLQPVSYDSTVKDGPKQRRVLVEFAPTEVMVSVSPKFGDWGYPAPSQPQKMEAVDPLTAILNMTLRTRATPANPCGGPLRIFDGKHRYDIRLRYAERVQWNTDAYRGPALKCEAEYIELAGFDAKSAQQKAEDKADIAWVNFILAELDGGAITPPIKLEGRSKRSGKYTIEATRLRYGRS